MERLIIANPSAVQVKTATRTRSRCNLQVARKNVG
jgi:hypothetical protein